MKKKVKKEKHNARKSREKLNSEIDKLKDELEVRGQRKMIPADELIRLPSIDHTVGSQDADQRPHGKVSNRNEAS